MQLMQEQVSSLKTELSAALENKAQVLQNVIKEQRELISSLHDQMEQMKVGSPHVAGHDADFSLWLSNDFVAFHDWSHAQNRRH